MSKTIPKIYSANILVTLIFIVLLMPLEAFSANVCPGGMTLSMEPSTGKGVCRCDSGAVRQLPTAGVYNFGNCVSGQTKLYKKGYSTYPARTPTTAPTTSLRMWLDANDPLGDGSIVANGRAITTWFDKSGFGNNATSSNNFAVGTNPNFQWISSSSGASGASGFVRPGIWFYRNVLLLPNMIPAGNQSFTFIMALQPVPDVTDTATMANLLSIYSPNGAPPQQSVFNQTGVIETTSLFYTLGLNGTSTLFNIARNNYCSSTFFGSCNGWTPQTFTSNSAATFAKNRIHIISFKSDTARTNGCLLSSRGGISSTINTCLTPNGFTDYRLAAPLYIGYDARNPNPFKGYIYEVRFYNAALSDANIEHLSKVMAIKWGADTQGIQGALGYPAN